VGGVGGRFPLAASCQPYCSTPPCTRLQSPSPPHTHRYTVTPGDKFGGDLLAYPGDPGAVHAQYVVVIRLTGQRLSGLQLVGRARVAASARKQLLIASCSGGGGDGLQQQQPVCYFIATDGRLQAFDLPLLCGSS